MNDKVITHADLDTLRQVRTWCSQEAEALAAALLDRLIAAAEADQPPLPEGWVVLGMPTKGSRRILWHEAGCLYVGPNGHEHLGDVDAFDRRNRLSPLRPTISRADFDRAWETHKAEVGTVYGTALHAAFEAAGVEVRP